MKMKKVLEIHRHLASDLNKYKILKKNKEVYGITNKNLNLVSIGLS